MAEAMTELNTEMQPSEAPEEEEQQVSEEGVDVAMVEPEMLMEVEDRPTSQAAKEDL